LRPSEHGKERGIGGTPCWCPFDNRPPHTDDEYFEVLAAAVFSARFNPDIVRARWPSIREAFAGFDLRLVASWPDSEVDRLLAHPGVIRNRKKVIAILRNGRDLVKRVERYGAVRAYLSSYGDDVSALVDDPDSWAHYIGTPSIRCYLCCAGILQKKR
jgi:3-methyladenine DNA glycosylase Tag